MPSSVPVRGRLLLCAALLACGSVRAQTVPAVPSLPPAAAAAEEVTLSVADFVAYALRHNPDLRAALQNREVAAGGLAAAAAYANPRLEVAQGNNRARLPGVTPGSVTSWSLAQLIENPALRDSRIAAARFGQQGVEGQVAATTSDLVAQVRLRAYEYLLRREEASAAADALELLEQIRSRVKLRVDSGEAPRYEIIKADAEVINARQKLGAAQLQVDQAAIGLDRLAAGRLPPRWRLAATLGDEQQLPSLGELQQQALDGNPELRVLRSEVQRREARLAEAQASRFPGVELRYGQVRDPEIRQNVLSATVQLPLLDRRTG
ncbi:MAG: TolC family protein, partial [Comamonadaceae bacterium]